VNLTFTRRTAKELVARAQTAVKAATVKAPVNLPYAGTFHSIACSLLNEFGADIGLKENFSVLDREDAANLIGLVRARSGRIEKKRAFPQTDACCAIHSYSRNACLSLKATLRKRYPGWKNTPNRWRKICELYRSEAITERS
jgi:DNA helicase-2/ATP-dependent DNA helicase PcrA